MPPKQQGEDDTKLQAVVLADSFQTRFMPLTSVKPRCLLPLANVPLIEYTLEFLAQSSCVDEVVIMCCAHADQIQKYIDESKWVSQSSPFKKIHTIASKESRSVGDAMRDIDSRSLISRDFMLVSGDVVTNLDISKLVEEHKKHKQGDRDYICTMVLKQASPTHRSRSNIEPACFILDKKTDKCLYYQDLPPINGIKSSVNIDPEVLEDVEEFVIDNDLIDCHVDICTAQVPTIFTENFDYQSLRSDFVKGLLSSDLLKKHIYAYITSDEYAARVESWQTFDGISQDVVERFCYPIVPERNLLSDQTYTYASHHVYKERDVRLSQSCKITSRVVIGRDTFIGDGTTLEGSVIGRGCKIGNNVILKNSYIWDGAIIEDGSIITNAIVADNAIIKQGSILKAGAIVGFNVVVDDNTIILENTKLVEKIIHNGISSGFASSDDESEEEEKNSALGDPSVVGKNGIGFLYDDETEDEVANLGYEIQDLELSDCSVASSTIMRHRKKKRSHSTTSAYQSDYYSEPEGENFYTEAIATVDRAMENDHDLDTALLELNTLRMSMNVTYHEVREATAQSILTRTLNFIDTETLKVKEAVEKVWIKWCKLFERQVFDDDDQVDLLLIIQKLCETEMKSDKLERETRVPLVLLHILTTLYNCDIVEEENIFKWWRSEESVNSEQVRNNCSVFVNWLQEAEEESESDDE